MLRLTVLAASVFVSVLLASGARGEGSDDTCRVQLPGDFDGDGTINIDDLAQLVEHVAKGGPGPSVAANADPNGDCCVDEADLRYMEAFFFDGGPAPVECTCVDPGRCCPGQMPGDVDSNGRIDAADVAALDGFLRKGIPVPSPRGNADVDGDCRISGADLERLRSYVEAGGVSPVDCTCLEPPLSCERQRPGDTDGDGAVTIDDLALLVDYIANGGPAPRPLPNADANGDCCIDEEDIYYLESFFFEGGPGPVECTCLEPVLCCREQYPGDADEDGSVDVADVIFLMNYVYNGGPAPRVRANGDPNGDCCIDRRDIDFLNDYLNRGGSAPVECTCLNPPLCCEDQRPGDIDSDGFLTVDDLALLVDFLENGESRGIALGNADADGDCCIDEHDVAFLSAYFFNEGPPPVECTCLDPRRCCEDQRPGDVDGSGSIDMSDLTFLIEFVYHGGPAPAVPADADPNGDCCIDEADVVYLNAYLAGGGARPVTCTCSMPTRCCGDLKPGDVDGNGAIEVEDLAVLVAVLRGEQRLEAPLPNADPNGDCRIDEGDMAYLRGFFFGDGPPPVECTCLDPVPAVPLDGGGRE